METTNNTPSNPATKLEQGELLPCPFCGVHLQETSDHHGNYWEHPANDCLCSFDTVLDDDCKRRWNRRAQPDKQPPLAETGKPKVEPKMEKGELQARESQSGHFVRCGFCGGSGYRGGTVHHKHFVICVYCGGKGDRQTDAQPPPAETADNIPSSASVTSPARKAREWWIVEYTKDGHRFCEAFFRKVDADGYAAMHTNRTRQTRVVEADELESLRRQRDDFRDEYNLLHAKWVALTTELLSSRRQDHAATEAASKTPVLPDESAELERLRKQVEAGQRLAVLLAEGDVWTDSTKTEREIADALTQWREAREAK